jgi:hypothetical protein
MTILLNFLFLRSLIFSRQSRIPGLNETEINLSHYDMDSQQLQVVSKQYHHQQQQQQQQQQHNNDQVQHNKVTKLFALLVSKSSKVLFLMVFVLSIFIVFITLAIRDSQNLLNPLVMIIHSWSFLITPLIIIHNNSKLKKFVRTTVSNMFSNNIFNFPYFNNHNKVHPILV